MLAGGLSGLLSVGLLALIHRTLESQGPSLESVGWIFAGLCVVLTLSRVGSVYLLSNLGQSMVRDLRIQLARRVLSTPLRRLEELGTSRVLATLTDDVNALTQALSFVPAVCINGTIVAGCLGYLAWVNGRLFLLLLVAVVVGVLTYYLPAQLGIRRFRQAREQEDVLFEHFRGLTGGIKELKLHRLRRGDFADGLAGTAETFRRLRIAAALIYGTAAAWGHLLFFVVIGVLLFLRPAFLDVEAGTLIGYTVVLLYMMTPMQTLLDSFPTLGRADVAVDKIERLGFDLSDDAPDLWAPPAVAAAPPAFERLELDGVTHAYHREGADHEFRLGPVDLALEPGELVFLVGGNGSGKTTLAKILVGLYAPDDGEIRLDGRPVDEARRDAYRQRFSVVFGDFHLFDRLLGLEAPDLDERARGYLESLEIAHKVRVDGGVLSTTDLSQGQRKRLALLIAYLEDRPVYVFDEWAADQDPVFKEVFYRQILPDLKARGKAVVAISHDDRYFHLADRVLKLEDGKVLAGEEARRRAAHVAAVAAEPG